RHEYRLAGKVEILIDRHELPSLICRMPARLPAKASRCAVHHDPAQTTWMGVEHETCSRRYCSPRACPCSMQVMRASAPNRTTRMPTIRTTNGAGWSGN